MGRYIEWLRLERGLDFTGYDELWRWSVTDLEGFWASLWDYFDVRAHAPYERVLGSREMPGAEWFPGARLNYAEHMLGRDEDLDAVAIVAHSQTREPSSSPSASSASRSHAREPGLSGSASARATASSPTSRTSRRRLSRSSRPRASVRSGRRARPSSACAASSTGSASSSRRCCSRSAATSTATSSSTRASTSPRSASRCRARAVVDVPYAGGADPGAISWDELLAEQGPLEFAPLPFAHPLYVLFSSGTTGLPKAIVHGHGGILLEHLKNLGLGWDVRPATGSSGSRRPPG